MHNLETLQKMSKEFNKHVEEHVDHTPTGRRGSYLRGSIVSIDRPNRRVSIVDDVFGEIVEDGPNYRDVCLSQVARARTS